MWRAVLHHTERKAAIGEEGRVEGGRYVGVRAGVDACIGVAKSLGKTCKVIGA